MVNNAYQREAVYDLFSRQNKIILRELGQNHTNCSNSDNSDINKIAKNIYITC